MVSGYKQRFSPLYRAAWAFCFFATGPLAASQKKNEPCPPGIVGYENCQFSQTNQNTNPHTVHFTEATQLKIPHHYLGKELLLHVSAAHQPRIALSNGIQSKIVVFELHGSTLVMRQSLRGQSVTDQMRQNLLLATFPVLAKDDQGVLFDFNAGMSLLPLCSNVHCSDIQAQSFQYPVLQMKLSNAYIMSIEGKEGRTLIRQMALTDATYGSGKTKRTPIEINYIFTEYKPDETFEVSQNANYLKFAFFETPPILKNGEATVYASKFHPKKPIVFAISANTPPEFKEAIKAGVLYWNRAFGEERVQVIDAPAGVQAPDLQYNVVQWVPWDVLGESYADFQMDPMTGEILHAQVYVTSFFAKNPHDTASQSLWRLDSQKERENHGETQKDSRFKKNNQILKADYIKTLLGFQSENKDYLELAKNSLAVTTAHEVGHTLGLRHNFAGSIDVDYPPEKRDEILASIVAQNGVPPENIRAGSSVMDYSLFLEEVLIGGKILYGTEVLPYDKMAIETLYKGKEYPIKETPPFCTDSHLGLFQDCKIHASGNGVVEQAVASTQFAKDYLAYDFLNVVLDHMKKTETKGKDVLSDLNMTPVILIYNLLGYQESLLKLFTPEGFTVKVSRYFPFMADALFTLPLGSQRLRKVRAEERKALAADLKRAGGLEKVFSLLPLDFIEETLKQFKDILKSPAFAQKLKEHSLSLTAFEKSQLNKLAKEYFKDFYKSYNESLLLLLGGLPLDRAVGVVTAMSDDGDDDFEEEGIRSGFLPFEESALSDDLASHLGTMAQEVILSRLAPSPEDQVRIFQEAMSGMSPLLGMTEFVYGSQMRILASRLFGVGEVCRGEARSWGVAQRLETAAALTQLAEAAGLPEDAMALKPEELNWILDIQEMVGNLQKIDCRKPLLR